MPVPRKRGILNKFDALPEEIKSYFTHFPKIADQFPWDVSISYMFSLVELAHNMTLYCGVVKCHKVDSALAKTAVDTQHLTRSGFKQLFETIFATSLKRATIDKLAQAEKVRDRILHGKKVTEESKRKAVIDILDYSVAFNAEVNALAGFKPFGSLQGFKGRAGSLDKSTSRWILKGIGLGCL
jgi:hypothetical protein